MIVVRGNGPLAAGLRGGAVALGNFDGVHRGHQAVIAAAVARARAAGRPALVGTFDPHPARFFRPDRPSFRLTSDAQKWELLAALGVDAVVVIPFTAELADLAAADFARLWLRDRLAVIHVATGSDFTFGRGRTGSVAELAALGRQLGFASDVVGPVCDGGDVISSTRIRAALAAGDPATAARLLGRPFAIRAPVLHGDQRGRTIGAPTANQELGRYVRPRYGVYAVRVRLPDGRLHDGVANLGIRPMFEPPRELLETFLLDWEGDLYGLEIEVQLRNWLRPERQLADLEALKRQISADVKEARALLLAADEAPRPFDSGAGAA